MLLGDLQRSLYILYRGQHGSKGENQTTLEL
jgi:hypothetical protein